MQGGEDREALRGAPEPFAAPETRLGRVRRSGQGRRAMKSGRGRQISGELRLSVLERTAIPPRRTEDDEYDREPERTAGSDRDSLPSPVAEAACSTRKRGEVARRAQDAGVLTETNGEEGEREAFNQGARAPTTRRSDLWSKRAPGGARSHAPPPAANASRAAGAHRPRPQPRPVQPSLGARRDLRPMSTRRP